MKQTRQLKSWDRRNGSKLDWDQKKWAEGDWGSQKDIRQLGTLGPEDLRGPDREANSKFETKGSGSKPAWEQKKLDGG